MTSYLLLAGSSLLILEDGDEFILEDGDSLLLEGGYLLLEGGGKLVLEEEAVGNIIIALGVGDIALVGMSLTIGQTVNLEAGLISLTGPDITLLSVFTYGPQAWIM
jgi:hypothetical protein